MKKYKAKVKINSSTTDVQVDANTYNDALKILEAQYGKKCIVNPPIEVKNR